MFKVQESIIFSRKLKASVFAGRLQTEESAVTLRKLCKFPPQMNNLMQPLDFRLTR